MDKASRLAHTHWGLASRTFPDLPDLQQLRLPQRGTPAIFLFAAAWDFALTSANSMCSPSMAIRWSSTSFFNSCSSGARAGGGADFTKPTASTSRLHYAITQKAPIIFGNPTSLSTGTPNFLTNVSSHSFLLSINTNSAISTIYVALAISMRGAESIKVEQILPLANAAKSDIDITAGRVYTELSRSLTLHVTHVRPAGSNAKIALSQDTHACTPHTHTHTHTHTTNRAKA